MNNRLINFDNKANNIFEERYNNFLKNVNLIQNKIREGKIHYKNMIGKN